MKDITKVTIIQGLSEIFPKKIIYKKKNYLLLK
jgi:hypothetical protein